MQKDVPRQNHFAVINDKTIAMFGLNVLPQEFLEDLKKIGYMPIHKTKNDSWVLVG